MKEHVNQILLLFPSPGLVPSVPGNDRRRFQPRRRLPEIETMRRRESPIPTVLYRRIRWCSRDVGREYGDEDLCGHRMRVGACHIRVNGRRPVVSYYTREQRAAVYMRNMGMVVLGEGVCGSQGATPARQLLCLEQGTECLDDVGPRRACSRTSQVGRLAWVWLGYDKS